MSTIVTIASASLVEPTPYPLTATFRYDDADPVAVEMTLALDHEVLHQGRQLNRSITWQFSRELLDLALVHPGVSFGHGDVQIEQLEKTLMFRVAGDSGTQQTVLVELEPVTSFMISSFVLVPVRREAVDVDAAIAQILGAAS